MSLNSRLFLKINSWQGQNKWLDAFGRAGAEWVIMAMVGWYGVGTFIQLRSDNEAVLTQYAFLACAWLAGMAISHGIGYLGKEPRPFVTLPETKKLISPIGTKSFPSDHAFSAWLIFFLAFVFNVPGFEALLPLALWVSWGRVYAGVHYPFDIVGGMVLAALMAVVVTYLSILYF